ncbi:MAG: bifunctional metallophosphatase/5'-nucleotidase [Prevotellaceae bacterium]|jgi:2',3'-cyclic-nucleotide 2'-phosphodiesterase (5'-nucleotidase family)|nr:bifunctional metallophosphatase/5'-nucleotidase [Prevotellaceae bacterium]
MYGKKLQIIFLWCSLCLGVPLPAQEITILFTHDLHSMFLPHRVQNAPGKFAWQGGYAPLYTAIRQAREQYPGQTVLVDAGDFSSGSLFYTLFTTDCAELQLMAFMHYDAVTLGNHDFDSGTDGLAEALTAAKQTGNCPPVVAANIKPVNPSLARLATAFDYYGVKEYIIVERNGKRIGIFGLMGDEAMRKAPAAAAVTFENQFDAAARTVKKLRNDEKVDLIVCLSHSGTAAVKKYSEDEQLAEKIPGIDIIISGHSHTLLPEPLTANQTVIASAGCHAEYLGVLTINADTKKLLRYYLAPVDSAAPADTFIADKINLFNEKLQAIYLDSLGRRMNDTVARSDYFLPAEALRDESPLGNLIADAFAGACSKPPAGNKNTVTAPIAVVPRGNIRDNLYPGWITEEQLFNTLSIGVGDDRKAGYPLVCVYLTGKELWDLCELDASCAPLFPDAQLYFSGLHYACNPRRLFCNKVTEVLVQEPDGRYRPPAAAALYPVVSSLYAAQMLNAVKKLTYGILSITPKNAQGQPVQDYLQHIRYTPEGFELKEWLALSNYLHALDGNKIPAIYAAPEKRKTISPSAAPAALLKRPNGFALLLYATAAALLAAAVWLLRKLKRRMMP